LLQREYRLTVCRTIDPETCILIDSSAILLRNYRLIWEEYTSLR
jgi:hypothetical protein